MAENPAGIHCILELYDCPSERLNDLEFICSAIKQAVRESMSTLLNLASHKFDPQGVTAVALLAESHISIHTWPEHGYAAVDIFTCGQTSNPHRACDFLVEQLGAGRHHLKVLSRGNYLPSNSHHSPDFSPKVGLCQAQN
ncbi:MAG: adenosylmethionine decarboxylase [Sedimentisphaerales bacterium]|nr:adenosylmethionine decarboxylase [Sedimentisphaerales bacterium]